MNKETLINELQFKAVRSSGAGGQHVNKVSSKVVLSFSVVNSEGLNSREKTLLYTSWASRLTGNRVLILTCDESRSQQRNKELVIQRFFKLLTTGLFVPKKRFASRPSKASIKRVKEKKKRRGELKKLRKKPDF